MFKGVIEWDIFPCQHSLLFPKVPKKGTQKNFFVTEALFPKTSTQQTPEILGHATIFFSPNAGDPRDPVTDGSRLES